MHCMNLIATSARATQCASTSTADAPADDMAQNARPSKFVGAPLIMEAASKVDKCLARLQSLQGTVTIPTAPVSASTSACMSPNFSRSKSCLHGSPSVKEDDKIRIHDVLRWSDDFSGNFKQERRDKYMKRLSRSKTEVFDDKKDPLDPHGEWKHWSSPAGDVHKVISEILMASQIAKQITSMVNAALVQDVSSDDGRTNASHRRSKDAAGSSHRQNRRKDDPLHKFRVVVATDGPVKRRSNAGSRKEVLYPKSKQPVPDRSKPADENQVMSSTAKKMQSRRSPRAAVVESRPRTAGWAAKEITNRRSPPRATPSHQTKKLVPANEKQLPSTALRRVRNARSPPWNIVEKPKLGTITSEAVKPCFIVKQGTRGPQVHGSAEPRLVTSDDCPNKSDRRTLPAEAAVVASKESSAITEVPGLPPAAVPQVIHPSPAGSVVVPTVEESSAATSCNPVLPSIITECRPSSRESSQQQSPLGSSSYPCARSNPLIGSLRHKFVMEATEIKGGPAKPWRLNQTKSSKAVLFSNPAFAPASPPGARPPPERVSPARSKSPTRSSSAPRRVMNRIGRALSARGRSISPELTQRINSTRQKLISLSPAKSLPSLISRLPSRGKKSSSAPRASVMKTTSCSKPAPISGELPLPPGRKIQQQPLAAQDTAKRTDAPAAATNSSKCNVGPLKDQPKDGNAYVKGTPNIVANPIAKGTTDGATKPEGTTDKATKPEGTTDIATKPTGTAEIGRKKGNLVKSHSESHWENQVGVIGVLSYCRRWVEESAPPPGGGRFEKEEPALRPTQKENVVPSAWDDEVGVIGFLSSCRRRVDENVQPAVAGCATSGTLKRSLSVGSRSSRSSSTGKVRSGSALLKRARDWMRTQTPYRDRPHQPAAM